MMDALVRLALAAYLAASLAMAATACGDTGTSMTPHRGITYTTTLFARVGQQVTLPLRLPQQAPYQSVSLLLTFSPTGVTLPLTVDAFNGCSAAMGPGRSPVMIAIACPGPRLSDGIVGTMKVLAQHKGTVTVRQTRCEVDEWQVPCGPDVTLVVR
jgi:hypothetical protein